MVNRLWTEQLGNWGLVSSMGRNFCLCCYIRTGSEVHLTTNPVGTRCFFPTVKIIRVSSWPLICIYCWDQEDTKLYFCPQCLHGTVNEVGTGLFCCDGKPTLKGLRTNFCHFNRGSSAGRASNRGDAERRNVHHWNWGTCIGKEWRWAQITTSIWWVSILPHSIASFFINPKAWQPDAYIQVCSIHDARCLLCCYKKIKQFCPMWLVCPIIRGTSVQFGNYYYNLVMVSKGQNI